MAIIFIMIGFLMAYGMVKVTAVDHPEFTVLVLALLSYVPGVALANTFWEHKPQRTYATVAVLFWAASLGISLWVVYGVIVPH